MSLHAVSRFVTDWVSTMNNRQSQKGVWEGMLRTLKAKKRCMGCNRGVDHSEEAAILAYVSPPSRYRTS